MNPTLILILLLAGCATHPPTPASQMPSCPASIPVPTPIVGKATAAKVGDLEIRVELAREAERERGDCWRDAVGGVR